jgi:uncharacterized membrane protein YdjX (TVP38/TMEM64 family)
MEHLLPTLGVLICIVVLPSFGVPNCPLLVFAGGYLGSLYGIQSAAALAIGAVFINIAVAYWIAAYPLRRWLQKRIRHRAASLLGLKPRSVLLATAILHITPGVPLCLQTYFPGVNRLNYWQYLGIALPIQGLYTAGIVATGGVLGLPVAEFDSGGVGAMLMGGLVIYMFVSITRNRAIITWGNF